MTSRTTAIANALFNDVKKMADRLPDADVEIILETICEANYIDDASKAAAYEKILDNTYTDLNNGKRFFYGDI